MKAIHWRIKVTYNFNKRLTKRLTWDDTRRPPARPDITILKDRFFGKKKHIQKWINGKVFDIYYLPKNTEIFFILRDETYIYVVGTP